MSKIIHLKLTKEIWKKIYGKSPNSEMSSYLKYGRTACWIGISTNHDTQTTNTLSKVTCKTCKKRLK